MSAKNIGAEVIGAGVDGAKVDGAKVDGARILLLVTGGIAAYKACYLTRLLVQAGFAVKVAMTEAAQHFVAPLTFQVLSGHPVASDLWGEGQGEAMDHIEYARWADLVVAAPATANLIAKAAGGIADDIVTTLLLAFPGPVLFAPAMNDNMWRHAATQANLATLRERGVTIVEPSDGFLACGTEAVGRLAEPEAILAAVGEQLAALEIRPGASANSESSDAPSGADPAAFWSGRRVVITAGPTHEAIDPVRYLANRSTGVFGYALAEAAVRCGAAVTLISGPTCLVPPAGIDELILVETADEMAEAVERSLRTGADWLIMAAAVADFAPVKPAADKIKKDAVGPQWQLELARTVDILGEVVPAHRSAQTKVVGFALETEDLLARAQAKMQSKGLDYVVANDPTRAGSGFGARNHQIKLIGPEGLIWASESIAKTELAIRLLGQLAADAGLQEQ